MRRALSLACLILLIVAAPLRVLSADKEVVVGILETLSPQQRTTLQRDMGHGAAAAVVRVAFRSRSGKWEAFRSDFNDVADLKQAVAALPRRANWTITHAGKALGQISSRSPELWRGYSEVGMQLVSAGGVPHVGKPSTAFRQWDSDAPVYRPLVLVPEPEVRDPDGWKPAKPAPSAVKLAIPALRTAIQQDDGDLKFADRDVRPLQAYRARDGRLLFALAVHASGPPDDGPLAPAAACTGSFHAGRMRRNSWAASWSISTPATTTVTAIPRSCS